MERIQRILFYAYVVISMILMIFSTLSHARELFNVLSYGAKPNGIVDSTQAFAKAWAAACGTPDAVLIYVPKGRYLVGPVRFNGEGCQTVDILVQIDGTLVGSADFRFLGKEETWLSFERVTGVSVVGGSLDAKGPPLWACKAAIGAKCPEGATTLSFVDSSKIMVTGLLSMNSQMFHIVFNRCHNVVIRDVRIVAPRYSPNTDGINVQHSTDIEIRNTSIKTGNDCISIGPGMQNLWIEGVTCGPGHGISIKGLGKDLQEEGVQNVIVLKTVFIGTDNGLSIKSWAKPSSGFVQKVRFLNSVMSNVKFPLIIDQHYCPKNINCSSQESGIKINDVVYSGIRGTSSTKIAIKMDCSGEVPCTGIRMKNINLTYHGGAASTSCSNVVGNEVGYVIPTGCL